MSRTTPRVLNLAALVTFALPLAVVAAGGGSSAPSTPALPDAPAMTVADYYNKGLKHRDKAWEYEAKAAGLEGNKAEKMLEKARKEYEKAIKAQQEAIKLEPRAYQALSSLGYALRRVGRYDESIAAYDRSLALNPSSTEAIEYRAEAYLELGRLDDAKDAYMHLFTADRAKADELMTAMQKWVESRSGAEDTTIQEFSAWVEERAQLAEQTAMLSGGEPGW